MKSFDIDGSQRFGSFT